MSPEALMPDRSRVMPPRLGLLAWATGTVLAMQAVNMGVFDAANLAGLPAFGLFAAGVVLLWRQLPAHYPHPRFGSCNGVTLFRAGLGASLLTPLLSGDAVQAAWGGWAVALVALFALLLDGVDGWLARRQGLVSGFGARFDMEIDAALALMLALHAFADGMGGVVVLTLGVMRYVFVAASWVLPWMAAPLPDKFGRKVVCVIQIAALIALQVPILGSGAALGIAWGAVAALLWSFGRDTLWLWRHRS
ncbi:MAG: CDP-alcohol phosphatidyltransferase family protein [Rhodobacterales bacterium]|nr:CDP-alcohol phosphatidyltransferase family protein [Rhodobacterales bacterium]MDX5390092.1 CDP-alcohol phosphatidyltransferase family protein [Rhodobacterales bacterium]MDX5489783.1 CDP-alcohol phosphatidyltransferase family protein [Rhodobacterales bacterium]